MTDTNDSTEGVSAAEVLGVPTSASKDEILDAYRERALRYHPDKFNPSESDVPDNLNPNDLFKDAKQARKELLNNGSGGTYNCEWQDGRPVTSRDTGGPTERTTGTGTDGNGEDDETVEGGNQENGTNEETGGGPETGSEESTGGGSGGWNTDDPENESASGIDDTIGVDVGGNSGTDGEDDDDEIEGSGGKTVTIGNDVSRRGLLTVGSVGLGAVVLANWLGVFNSDGDTGSGNNRTEEHVVVSSDDDLQEAVETIVPGGRLELEPGTYTQRVSLTEDVTMTAPEGATFAGNGADTTGIAFGDADIEIEGITIVEFDGGGIHSDAAGGTLTLSDVTVEDIGDIGVELAGEDIEVENLTVRDTVGSGISLSLPADGTATIDSVVTRETADSGVGAYTEGRGIVVEGGERVAINDAEVIATGNEGIHVLASETGSQAVNITDAFVADSASRSGIRIAGSRDAATVSLTDVEVVDNDNEGIEIGEEHRVDEVVLDGITVDDNDDTGLHVRVTDDGTFTLRNGSFNRNENDGVGVYTEGVGVSIHGGEEIVIEESIVTESGNENLRIEAEHLNGQSVEFRDVTVLDSVSRSGVRFDGSRGEDTIVAERCRADGNDNYGFDLAGESVRIEETSASGNGDGPLHLQDIDRDDAEIRDSF